MAGKRQTTEPPERTRLTVYLPPETHRALLHRAVDEGTKVTRIVEQLIDEYLARPARKGGTHGR